jgi:hypothetical protein
VKPPQMVKIVSAGVVIDDQVEIMERAETRIVSLTEKGDGRGS